MFCEKVKFVWLTPAAEKKKKEQLVGKFGKFCLEWVEKPVTAKFLSEQEFELCMEPFCTDSGLSFTALTLLLVLKKCSKFELGISREELF